MDNIGNAKADRMQTMTNYSVFLDKQTPLWYKGLHVTCAGRAGYKFVILVLLVT